MEPSETKTTEVVGETREVCVQCEANARWNEAGGYDELAMSNDHAKWDEYWRMVTATGEPRGTFKTLHVHLVGRTITYRPARWYERFWLWLIHKDLKTMVLNYDH